MKINKYIKRGVADLILCLIIILSIFPFIYMFIMSFKSTTNAADISISISKLSLLQYRKIFALENFGKYIFNSVFVAVAGVVLTVIVCSLAGYAFAKLNFKGNDKIFLIMVLTLMVPSEVIVAPLFLIVKHMNMLNTYWALILPLPTAFGVFIMRQAILGVPKDLMDAAKIDGCSDIKILKTLPLALGMMKTQYNTDVGLTMACAVINFLPPFIFYLFMQRKFKEGITLSGMKG